MASSSDNITLGTSDTPGELTVRVVTVEHKKTHLNKHAHHQPLPSGATGIIAVPSASSNGGKETRTGVSLPPSSNATPVVPPFIMVDDKQDLKKPHDDEEKKKKRKGILCGCWWCCPWYMIVGLLVLIALAIGLGVGLKKNEPSKGTSGARYDVHLKFNVYQKQINLTLVSSLRCLVANLTDPTKFDRIVMTSWEEYNGTNYFIDPAHPLNAATNCSAYFPDATFRRLQQSNNWIYPTDPITLNISTVPRPLDDDYTFIDDLYNNDKLNTIASLESMEENRDNFKIPLPPSPTRTSTPTPSSTISITSTPSTTITASITPSNSPTPSVSASPSLTSTSTSTGTSTSSSNPSSSSTSTGTSTGTSTSSSTSTSTSTSTTTATSSPSVSPRGLRIHRVKDFLNGTASGVVGGFVNFKNNLYFTAYTDGYGFELMRTNSSTPYDAVLVKDIQTGPSDGKPGSLTVCGDYIYMSANDGKNGWELWVSDGITTTMLEINTINLDGVGSDPSIFFCFGTKLLFVAQNGINGREPWVSDASSLTGTFMLKDIMPGDNSSQSYTNGYALFKDRVYFRAQEPTYGSEMYVTDGTVSGTYIFKDLFPSGTASTPMGMYGWDDYMYFRATHQTAGGELWRSNGSVTNTALVKDLSACCAGSPQLFFAAQFENSSSLLFLASDGINGGEPWITNGTAEGTYMLKNIHPTSASGINTWVMFRYIVYFPANDGTGSRLWRTDGTTDGTYLYNNVSGPNFFTYYNTYGTKLYFSGADGNNDRELWVMDDTGYVSLVKDINPLGSSNPSNFVVADNALYFLADDGISGPELWISY